MMRGFPTIAAFPPVLLVAGIFFAPVNSQSLRADVTNAAVAFVPKLAPSPVQAFRQLLVLSPEDRAQQLELHPPGMREPIEAKVQEYLTIPAEDRELRLQATELRHYLLLLMPLHSTNRATLIPQIEEPMRTAVEARLVVWDIMPPSMQEELLLNEQVVRYFTQHGERKSLLETMPAAQRMALETNIARWKALPQQARKNVFAQMGEFFDLTAPEREKAMKELSQTERDAMTQTLDAFNNLSPDQREVCIRSFEKFASMSLPERQMFLKKAEAWQKMTATEREHWRAVVTRVPELPPFPPGMDARMALPLQSEPQKPIPPLKLKTNGG